MDYKKLMWMKILITYWYITVSSLSGWMVTIYKEDNIKKLKVDSTTTNNNTHNWIIEKRYRIKKVVIMAQKGLWFFL